MEIREAKSYTLTLSELSENKQNKMQSLAPSGCGRQVVVLEQELPIRRTHERELIKTKTLLRSVVFDYQ